MAKDFWGGRCESISRSARHAAVVPSAVVEEVVAAAKLAAQQAVGPTSGRNFLPYRLIWVWVKERHAPLD